MRILIVLTILFCLLLVALAPGTAVRATPDAVEAHGPTIRASVSSGGGQGNAASSRPAVSADGRYIAFSSDAANLVSGDTNGVRDIFVYDRVANTTQRVSIRTGGEQANGTSFSPAISDDGRVVAFYSLASNLVSGDTNGRADVFAHDRQTGQTSLMSVVLNGTANGDSRDPDISGDGRYVVFASSASNLVGGDTNQADDIFRWDRVALIMERISVDSNGAQANNFSRNPAINGNGQRIVFTSDAGNLVAGDGNFTADIFLRDTSTGITSRVSITDGGGEANGTSWLPDISSGGQHIVFVSFATNLVGNDNNGYADVFLRNTGTGRTHIISIATDGAQGNNASEDPSVSADGRYVAFDSFATSLSPGTSPDLRKLFVRDRTTNTLLLASISTQGIIGNQGSREAALAANGRYVAYTSDATNLVANDTNQVADVFLHDFIGPPTLSVNFSAGAPGSIFVFEGTNWQANSTAVVRANGVTLGDVNTDGSGNLTFQIVTGGATQQGLYIISVTQGSAQLSRSILVRDDAPLRPGTGGGLGLPDGIALDEFIYLPIIRR
ncbi:MAG: PD40 domain-containing protein [Anaerolineae bacterium]|nr:PD40 domain-containing protein [Anaerolineae bacterium]